MVFGERLKRLREGKYSQEELANKLHVHNVTISKWESGTQEPRSKRVAELAKILGTTTEYLLGDTDDPTMNTAPKALPTVPLKDTGHTLIYERNGERMELPPTEESYAIFRDLAAMIAKREAAPQPAMV